jgi:hypothetical protein
MKITANTSINGEKAALTVDFPSLPENFTYADVVKAYGVEVAEDATYSGMVIRLKAWLRNMLQDGVDPKAAQKAANTYTPGEKRSRVPADPEARALALAISETKKRFGMDYNTLPDAMKANILQASRNEVARRIAVAERAGKK